MPFSVSLPCPLTPPPYPFQIHEEFKELVDALLTDFITELGVSGETFYEVVAAENSGGDKLNRCVHVCGGEGLDEHVGGAGLRCTLVDADTFYQVVCVGVRDI